MLPLVIQQILRILSRVKRVLSGVIFVLTGAYVAGVIGFHYIEGLDWLDAAYFTFVTLSTIGFGDITPKTAYGKVLVMAIAMFGVAAFAVAVTSIVQSLVTERMSRILGLINPYMRNHVVVCGWNETAKAAIEELLASTNKKIVIVDDKLERVPFDDPRVEFVKGDCKDRATLERAGVDKASDVIVATGSDSDTILTVLQVKAINKDVHVAAEVRGGGGVEAILKQAGADHVISSLSFGGRLLATSVTQPGTAFIFDDLTSTGAGSDIYEVKAPKELAGKTFRDIMMELKRSANVLPIAIRRRDTVLINPPLSETLSEDDYLVLIASPEEYERFRTVWRV